jgi:hypothetical protein
LTRLPVVPVTLTPGGAMVTGLGAVIRSRSKVLIEVLTAPMAR